MPCDRWRHFHPLVAFRELGAGRASARLPAATMGPRFRRTARAPVGRVAWDRPGRSAVGMLMSSVCSTSPCRARSWYLQLVWWLSTALQMRNSLMLLWFVKPRADRWGGLPRGAADDRSRERRVA